MIDEKTFEAITPKNITPSKFAAMVEEIVSHADSYIDAVLKVAEENAIEPEQIRNYLTPTLKRKLYEDSKNRNLLKDEHKTHVTLPL